MIARQVLLRTQTMSSKSSVLPNKSNDTLRLVAALNQPQTSPNNFMPIITSGHYRISCSTALLPQIYTWKVTSVWFFYFFVHTFRSLDLVFIFLGFRVKNSSKRFNHYYNTFWAPVSLVNTNTLLYLVSSNTEYRIWFNQAFICKTLIKPNWNQSSYYDDNHIWYLYRVTYFFLV